MTRAQGPAIRRSPRCARPSLIGALTLLGLCGSPSAEVLTEVVTVAGVDVLYRTVLPENYDRTQAYPGVLAFGGGGQTAKIVDRMIERNWEPEAERRGFVVISPIAPDAGLYFQGGDVVFPELLEHVLARYAITERKFHVAGISNGGASAFHIAALYPSYFVSVTGLPGYLPYANTEKIAALAGLCIYMHVGERDRNWIDTMVYQAQQLTDAGARLRFWIEPGEGHVMRSLQGSGAVRLFEHFEEATAGCKPDHP